MGTLKPLTILFDATCDTLDRLLQLRFSVVVLTLLCIAVCFCFSFPRIDYIANALGVELSKAHQEASKPYFWGHWDSVMEKVENPFAPPSADPASHEGKLAFRLTVPLFAHYLGLTPGGIILSQMALGWCFFALLLHRGSNFFRDRQATVLLALGLATLYVGYSGPASFTGRFDSVAYFFVLAALLFRSPLLIFFSLQLALWTDERALISAMFVCLWWVVQQRQRVPKTFVELLPSNAAGLSVVASVLTYGIVRIIL